MNRVEQFNKQYEIFPEPPPFTADHGLIFEWLNRMMPLIKHWKEVAESIGSDKFRKDQT